MEERIIELIENKEFIELKKIINKTAQIVRRFIFIPPRQQRLFYSLSPP